MKIQLESRHKKLNWSGLGLQALTEKAWKCNCWACILHIHRNYENICRASGAYLSILPIAFELELLLGCMHFFCKYGRSNGLCFWLLCLETNTCASFKEENVCYGVTGCKARVNWWYSCYSWYWSVFNLLRCLFLILLTNQARHPQYEDLGSKVEGLVSLLISCSTILISLCYHSIL